MRLVYHYTHEDGVPEWLDGVCVQREKRRRMTAPLEWKRSYGELATSESDDAMSQDGGGSPGGVRGGRGGVRGGGRVGLSDFFVTCWWRPALLSTLSDSNLERYK